ncbi:MAG: hypothetical protein ACFFB5_18075 [Promethearchaeota archaeon]
MKKLQLTFLLFLIISNVVFSCSVRSNSNDRAEISLRSRQIIYNVAHTTLKLLVILMELPDDPHHPTHTIHYYENLFFSTEADSVSQYFRNTSYGEVILEGEILGWYQANHNLSYYGAGERLGGIPSVDSVYYGLAEEARTHAINAKKDPQDYDLFIVIHSGDGQEYSGNSNDIWSHKGSYPIEYSMNHEYVDYVTPSHELGHELYFPDLYDYKSYQNIFAGPYDIMAYGEGHFSIWNKYYSRISQANSPRFLSNSHRLQITNFTNDTITNANPLALTEPSGIMWLELEWNSTGFSNPEYGRGWTVTVREDLDYDRYLPKHGIVIAEIQVGPRASNQIQVGSDVWPPWNVIDAHPETSENKEDAAFSLVDGDIGTYCSKEGWAIQVIEKYENLSYCLRVTNESKIPQVEIVPPIHSIKGCYDILVTTTSPLRSNISRTEISIDNGPWKTCNPAAIEGTYYFEWNTTGVREGTHLVRARALDNTNIPYIGYSSFINVEVDNTDGIILVVDDDLGRSSETSILSALDKLGYSGQYEILQTSSLTDAEISAEEMRDYEYVIWVGNPAITPISNSHINYNEFQEIKQYLESSTMDNPSRIIFMSNYNIFDFSNQGSNVHDEIAEIFRARSPTNFRAPVTLLRGLDFLESLPSFTLGFTNTLRANRSSDGEVVTLLAGAVSILEDVSPEFIDYSTKGYYIDTGEYKLINYLFQPELVPDTILPNLLDLSINYLNQPNNSTFTTHTATLSDSNASTSGIEPLFFIGMLTIGVISIFLYIRKIGRKI